MDGGRGAVSARATVTMSPRIRQRASSRPSGIEAWLKPEAFSRAASAAACSTWVSDRRVSRRATSKSALPVRRR